MEDASDNRTDFVHVVGQSSQLGKLLLLWLTENWFYCWYPTSKLLILRKIKNFMHLTFIFIMATKKYI